MSNDVVHILFERIEFILEQTQYDHFENELKDLLIQDIQVADNTDDLIHYLDHYRRLFHSFRQMPVQHNVSDQMEDVSADNKNNQSKKETPVYVFHRRLVGGMGIDANYSYNEVYVPETIVRDQGLEHGDQFTIKKAKDPRFNIYNKTGQNVDSTIDDNYVIEHDYCIVEHDPTLNEFITRKHLVDGELKRFGTHMLHDNDIEKFNIQNGDVIDISNAPDRTISRIRWKYNINETPPMPKPSKSSEYKQKSKDDSNQRDVSHDFEGFTIGVLGGGDFIHKYRDDVKARGGQLTYTDMDSASAIERVVKKADIVVVPLAYTSHNKSIQGNDYAKKHNKPYVTVDTNGRTAFIQAVQHCIDNEFKN